jgi:hypothetical protein
MNAVINRIISMAERIGPNLRTPGAKLGLAQAITAAIPAHCNESVSVTRTIAAPPSRRKIIGSPHGSRESFVHAFVGDPCGNVIESRPQAFGSRSSLLLPASTKIAVNADQT